MLLVYTENKLLCILVTELERALVHVPFPNSTSKAVSLL